MASASQAGTAPVTAPTAAESPLAAVQAGFDWVAAQKSFLKENYGITPRFSYEAAILGNPVGGLSGTAAYSQMFTFGFDLDMEKLAGVPGGQIVVTARQGGGRSLLPYVGNLFDPSQSNVRHGIYLTQFFWQQTLADEMIVIQAGRLNTSAFAKLPVFGMQVNGGVDGNPSSLGMNGAFTSSSKTTWGGRVTVTPDEDYYVAGGIYQASRQNGKQHGLDFSIRGQDRLYTMLEAGWTPVLGDGDSSDDAALAGGASAKAKDGLPGRYVVGSYYSNLSRERFDGTGSITDTYGFYLLAQQMVWRSSTNADNSVILWGGLTYSPQTAVAKMPLMGFSGFVWQGLVPGRNQDKLLGAVLVGSLSSDYADSVAAGPRGRPGNSEVVLDFSYIISLVGTAFVQPNIQYIMNPGGYSSTQDALVVGMQFGVSF